MRELPQEEANAFVPGVVAYYKKTKRDGAIWVLALLLARPLEELRERLDPNVEPSWLWEWLRDAAAQGLEHPLMRVESRLVDRIQAREVDRRTVEALSREHSDLPQAPSPDPWLPSRFLRVWSILSPKEQLATWLVWGLDYTHEEAAAELRITTRAVRYRLLRAQQKVARLK